LEQRQAIDYGTFVKIYGKMLSESSLLMCKPVTRWVFLYVLSQADENGFYRCAGVQNLAHAANVTMKQAQNAIEELQAVDPDSTSPDKDGCRLIRIQGGWHVVTYRKYREYRSKKQIRDSERQRQWREENPKCDMSQMSQRVAPEVDLRDLTNQSDLDLELSASNNGSRSKERPLPQIRWNSVKENFEGEDLEALWGALRIRYNDLGGPRRRAIWDAMCEWCSENPRKIMAKKDYRRFILNWFRSEAKEYRARQRQ
jgi:hypothetical protein